LIFSYYRLRRVAGRRERLRPPQQIVDHGF
jgi:hypothetical protein